MGMGTHTESSLQQTLEPLNAREHTPSALCLFIQMKKAK